MDGEPPFIYFTSLTAEAALSVVSLFSAFFFSIFFAILSILFALIAHLLVVLASLFFHLAVLFTNFPSRVEGSAPVMIPVSHVAAIFPVTERVDSGNLVPAQLGRELARLHPGPVAAV